MMHQRAIFLVFLLGCYHDTWVDYTSTSTSESSSSSSSSSPSPTWVSTVTTHAPDAPDPTTEGSTSGDAGLPEGLACNNDGVCDEGESGPSCGDCADCGNGILDVGEDCDGGEGCEEDCRWTPAAACSGASPTADELAELVPVCLDALDYASALSCLLAVPEPHGCDAALWGAFLSVFKLCELSTPVCWQAWNTWPEFVALWTCKGC